MERLTVKSEKDGLIYSAFSLNDIMNKLAEYENLEEKLEKVYGECDGLLEMAVNQLTNIAPNTGKPHKSRLLTDEAVDKWEFYKRAEENGKLFILPIGIGTPVYVIEKCKCGIHNNCRSNKKAHARTKAIIIERDVTKKSSFYGTQRNCIKIFERPFKIEYLKQLGKTVFITLEEAKAAAEKIGV